MNITVHFLDGSTREFKHEGRAGGSYTKKIRYEPGFVVIEDEWGKETSIPTSLVKEIETHPIRW